MPLGVATQDKDRQKQLMYRLNQNEYLILAKNTLHALSEMIKLQQVYAILLILKLIIWLSE